MKKSSGGFTLIEMVVTIICCSVVTIAAMTLLGTGLRVEAGAEATVERQQTARSMITLLEKLAGSGKISSVETVGDDWVLRGGEGNDTAYLYYSAEDQTLRTTGGAVMMEGVTEATATIDESNKLLSFSINDGTEEYSTKVYCRTAETKNTEVKLDAIGENNYTLSIGGSEVEKTFPSAENTSNARTIFLATLATQIGQPGTIKSSNAAYDGAWYSQWYICDGDADKISASYTENGNNYAVEGWNKDTPWCACFASWGMNQSQVTACLKNPVSAPCFSWVVDGINYFKADNNEHKYYETGSGYVPVPGDLVFFDWQGTKQTEKDADHVGVVLYADSGRNALYTIEGNSNGKVSLCAYPLDDYRVMGYGVLDWVENTQGG